MPHPAETAARPSIFGRLRSRFGIGRDGAAQIEKALKARESGDLDGAITALHETFGRAEAANANADPVLIQTGRLLLAEYQAEAGLRDRNAESLRAGLRVLITLPRGNVNDLRNGDIPWPEKLARAEELLSKALNDRGTPDALKASVFLPEAITLASAFNLLREHESARRTCRAMLAQSTEESPALCLVLAETEFGLGNHHEAIEALSRAIRTGIPPESDSFALALLGSLQRLDDQDISDHAEILTGELHCFQGRANQGLPMLQRAIERQGDRAELGPIRSLMGHYAKTRRLSEFEDTLNLLLRRVLPDVVRLRLTREIEEMSERYPDRPRLRGALAILRHRSGEASIAIANLVTLLSAHPELAPEYDRLLQSVPPLPPADQPTEPTGTLWFIRALVDGGAFAAAAALLVHLEPAHLDPIQAADARRIAEIVVAHLPETTLPSNLLASTATIPPEPIPAPRGPTPAAPETIEDSHGPPPSATTLPGPAPTALALTPITATPGPETLGIESPKSDQAACTPAALTRSLTELASRCPGLRGCAVISPGGVLLAEHCPGSPDPRQSFETAASALTLFHLGISLLTRIEASCTPSGSDPHGASNTPPAPPSLPNVDPAAFVEVKTKSLRATVMEAGPKAYLVVLRSDAPDLSLSSPPSPLRAAAEAIATLLAL